MKKVVEYIYFLILLPILILTIHIIAIFNTKIRTGLFARSDSILQLKNWLNMRPKENGSTLLIHAASMGEYEHIKPLLRELKRRFNTCNIVSFFSPSGYEHVFENQPFDFKMYMPIDTGSNWRKILQLAAVKTVIISKHDVWPGLIWTAWKMQIPVYLINASLSSQSSRIKPVTRNFMKYVYQDFDEILAISEEDKNRFIKYFQTERIRFIGDTKYDQVVQRKEDAKKSDFLPAEWADKYWVFLCGSIWPEDEQIIFPAIKDIMNSSENFACILVPHQPDPETIERIQKEFVKFDPVLFSERENVIDQKVVIIDAVGYLAGLYKYGKAAYVGGSFKQGIHNVMEPAIYGIPVFYGPVHRNSYEAIKFAESGGGLVINTCEELKNYLSHFLKNENTRVERGQIARVFALRNTGATEKIIEVIRERLT